MKNTFIKSLTILLVIVGGYYWYTSNRFESTESSVQTREEKINTAAQMFLQKYPDINTGISSTLQYSYQLENAMVTTGTPVVFTATIDDIFNNGGDIFIRFAPTIFNFGDEPSIFYTLAGCSGYVDEITSREKGMFNEYVVVAKITNVYKPTVRINSYSTGQSGDVEFSEANTFMATGTCLDLNYIGS